MARWELARAFQEMAIGEALGYLKCLQVGLVKRDTPAWTAGSS